MRNLASFLCIVCLAVSGIPALADSITPSSFSTTLAVGGTASLNKIVTITTSVTAPVDIMFLSDTTGSMGGAIASVRSGVSGIIAATAPLSPSTMYAVGEYRDRFDVFQYRLNQALTNVVADVQTGVNMWSAGGGADGPESNLYALREAASTLGWRPFSNRMLFWIGDYPGHDPGGPLANPATEAQAIAALNANLVRTYAIDLGLLDSGPAGTGCNPSEGGCAFSAGQATRITAATGGQVVSGGYSQAATLIQTMILTGLSEYHTVELLAMGLPPGLAITLSPAWTGSWTRDMDRTFPFTVGFTGLAAGVYEFDIAAIVDGTFAAFEHDRIVVGVPEPLSLLLMGSGLLALGALRWRKKN